MVSRVPWLTGVDRVVLEMFHEHDIVFTPATMANSLEKELGDGAPSYSQISKRMQFLRNEPGMLEEHDDKRGNYVLSDLGRRYLEDDLEDEEAERLAKLNVTESEDNED